MWHVAWSGAGKGLRWRTFDGCSGGNISLPLLTIPSLPSPLNPSLFLPLSFLLYHRPLGWDVLWVGYTAWQGGTETSNGPNHDKHRRKGRTFPGILRIVCEQNGTEQECGFYGEAFRFHSASLKFGILGTWKPVPRPLETRTALEMMKLNSFLPPMWGRSLHVAPAKGSGWWGCWAVERRGGVWRGKGGTVVRWSGSFEEGFRGWKRWILKMFRIHHFHPHRVERGTMWGVRFDDGTDD